MALTGMATVPRACVLSQKHSVRGMSCRHVATRVVNRRRGFYVRANGLNKWCVGCVDMVWSDWLHASVSCGMHVSVRHLLMGWMMLQG